MLMPRIEIVPTINAVMSYCKYLRAMQTCMQVVANTIAIILLITRTNQRDSGP